MTVGLSIVLLSVRFPYIYRATWKSYVGGFSLPSVGITVGFVVPKLLRMDYSYARTVAIETALQNFPLCMGAITLSFSRQHTFKLLLVPLVTGLAIMVNCLTLVIVYRLMKIIKTRRERSENQKCNTITTDEGEHDIETEINALVV